MDAQQIREVFAVDDALVPALAGYGPEATSQQQYLVWAQALDAERHLSVEYLLPRIHQEIRGGWPEFAGRRIGHLGMATADLAREVEELAPWTIPFPLGNGITTMDDDLVAAVAAHRILYRRDLIGNTVAALLGEGAPHARVLDIGCGCGFFSMDLAERGVAEVKGLDLRPGNIAQARFLAEHYGIDNVEFETGDADDLGTEETWDVVLNLGVLYHVVNPLQLIRQTYELCTRFAIIDTVCHREPVSGYFLFGNKDVSLSGEGRENYELHPTYRGVIDTLHYGGFREVFEIVGDADKPHDMYANGSRRCFLAVK